MSGNSYRKLCQPPLPSAGFHGRLNLIAGREVSPVKKCENMTAPRSVCEVLFL